MFNRLKAAMFGPQKTQPKDTTAGDSKSVVLPDPQKKTLDKQKSTNAKEAKQVSVELVKINPKNCPAPLLKEIAHDAAENKDLASMALVCRGFYHATRPVLDEAKLAHHVIFEPTHANKDKILAMAIANPDLVDKRIRHSKDRSGRVFTNKTIFQLAYGAGDDDFCLVLRPVFIKRYGDENAAIAAMKRQREEMCGSPEEEKNKEAVSKAHLEEILKPVIAAIRAEQFNLGRDKKNRLILDPRPNKTLEAIKQFRKEYAKVQPNEGMHFRYNSLSEVLAVYAQIAAGWNYNYNRCALFEDAVLSTILLDLPVNDAMRAAQGLYYLQNEEKPDPFNRSLALREGGDNFHEVVRGDSVDFVLDGCCVNTGFVGLWSVGATDRGRGDFQLLCQTKTANLRSSYAARSVPSRSPACKSLT